MSRAAPSPNKLGPSVADETSEDAPQATAPIHPGGAGGVRIKHDAADTRNSSDPVTA